MSSLNIFHPPAMAVLEHDLPSMVLRLFHDIKRKKRPEMEFNEFEPRFKSAKPRFKFSAGLNFETFDTVLCGTNVYHI